MYIKIVVFFTVVFSLKSIYCGVNVDNIRNTQNGQNMNRPLPLQGSYNIKKQQPNISHQQHQYIKDSTQKPSPLLRQPLEKQQKKLIPNQMFENLRYNRNQHAVVAQTKDKISTNIDGQTQLKHEYSNHPGILKVMPFTSLVEDKNKIGTSNENTRSHLSNTFVRSSQIVNENKKIIIPSLLYSVSRAPNIDVKKHHLNKLIPTINKDKNFTSNHGHRQKPANNQQNVFNHKGNIQPQRTLQNPGRNTQTNYSSQNKRFALIRKNGAVEYFDDLEIIRKKYPHIRIAESIQHFTPAQIPKMKFPVVNPMTHSFANVKRNQPLQQYSNLRNENVSPRKVPMHTVNNTHKPRTENISQKNNISEIYSNFSTPYKARPLQGKVDDMATAKSETLTIKNKKISILPTNNIVNKSINFQEYKPNNLTSNIRMPKQHENVVPTKVDIISKQNDTTKPHKNLNPNDGTIKPPIDVILNNSEHLPHQQDKPNTSSSNKHENPKNVKSIPEKGKDLQSNKSKEIISPITLNKNISNYKPPKSGNHLDLAKLVKNVSPLQNSTDCDKSYETVVGESQENDTKTKDKPKLKTQNLDDKSVKDDVSIDYDGDFLSLTKPIMWFSTNDPQFWKKILDDDDTPGFLYIINVQTQPKIEKDKKTIIHANGTIVEEITETVWDAEDDEPKITKTIKVTPANSTVNV